MKHQSSFALSIFFALVVTPSLRAQVGNNNPTGPAGAFNGNVTTGCSYDAFTGNAKRTVTDMVVPGAIGAYPLAFSRTSNSRDSSSQFGSAGAWRHSYTWEMEDSVDTSNQFFSPTYYTVSFPDGRVITFTSTPPDPYFRGPPGVRERFQPLDTGTLLAYLVLSDGGKIEFMATRNPPDCDPELHPPCTYSYSYKAQAIIDPYGVRTTLAYNGDGTLNTISEPQPAGRWIQILYTTTPWTNGYGLHDLVIDHITSSDGRSVQYNYGLQTFAPGTLAYTYLGNAVYYGDSSLTAVYTYVAPNVAPFNGFPLLGTASDPMYSGPMKNISYIYATGTNGDNSAVVTGQIRYEKSGDGQTVSNLQVITSGRAETKGDGSTRYFDFPANGYQVSNWSDFVNFLPRATRQYNPTTGFLSSFKDFNGNTTTITCDATSGNPTLVTYPLTASDTALGKPAATLQYVYGSASCPDPNNQDGNNPYHLYSATNERGYATIYKRDPSKRVTEIDHPNGGMETFVYNGFGQVTSHRLATGGLETYTYDGRGLLTEYRDAYHLATVDPQNPTVPASATPSFSYTYYTSGPWFDRLKTITDARGKVTMIDQYNSRGQVLKQTHPLGQGEVTPSNVQGSYNPDGTLQWSQDELGHRTSYGYDDYKRMTSVTLPPRATGSPSPGPTLLYYDHTGGTSTTDYSHTDANPTRIMLPSQKMTKTVYNSNLLKTSVTVAGANGVTDAATTTYTYDYNGNVKTVTDPNGQASGLYSQYFYDTRNRLTDADDPIISDRNSNGHTISWILDQAGNKFSQLNANGQLITFDSYDATNHLLQQTAPQGPDPAAVTKYTYYPSGLLNTMKDPLLVATGSGYSYACSYDLMGRYTRLDYPAESRANLRSEDFSYDVAGRLQTYTNRAGAVQTFSYDDRNRYSSSIWSDGTTAPAITCDPASRITQITNADAVINNVYFDDNTLKSQEEWATADTSHHRTVTYGYDVDGNRGSALYPSGKSYSYGYSGRNQLWYIVDNATALYQTWYVHDPNGNATARKVSNNTIVTDASQRDAMNRIRHLEHHLVGQTRTLDYTYDSMGNRLSIQRDGGTAESYSYDLAQQVTAGVDGVPSTYRYDANGNRNLLIPSGGSYVTNNLNQQTTFNGIAVSYGANANVATYASASYVYDAQNRLKSVTSGGVNTTFKYDGLNRKISQTTGSVTTYNVWDGWNLIEERSASNALLNTYLYGAGEIVERITGTTPTFYFQDGLGSTSHVSDATGNLLESYKYNTFGLQVVYAPDGTIRKSGSSNDIRHLYTGQLWMPQAGLYDYRNRVYSPNLTRFLQPDPIGFAGDPSNLYRYCGNNSLNRSDPDGEFTPVVLAVIGIGLVGILIWNEIYLSTHHDMEQPHTEQDNNPQPLNPMEQEGKRLPRGWGPGGPREVQNSSGGGGERSTSEGSYQGAYAFSAGFNPFFATRDYVGPAWVTDGHGGVYNYYPESGGGVHEGGGGFDGGIYDSYGSTTAAAASWEASWGDGSNWLTKKLE